MSARHDAVFRDTGRKARQAPHPGYGRGLVVDMAAVLERACAVDLAWPAAGVGTWEIRCRQCGVSIALTAAGRVDDPRRVILPCGRIPTADGVTRRPWTDSDETPAKRD